MSGLEGELVSQDVQVDSHGLVAVIPVKGVTLDETDTNDPHVPGDQLLRWRLALLAVIAVLWHS